MSNSVLNKCKIEFDDQIAINLRLIQIINTVNPPLQQDQIWLIYELSFLKTFLFWEWFIEKSFISYMMGIKTNSGYCPQTHVIPNNEQHAYDFVKEGRDYADWTSLDIIFRKAKLFFKNGEPFYNSLIPISQDIQDMKTIRNAIVHMSSKTKDNFESLLRKKFGHAKTSFNPGEYLSTQITNNNYTYISYYIKKLQFVSAHIVK